jgi:hypothetical protein
MRDDNEFGRNVGYFNGGCHEAEAEIQKENSVEQRSRRLTFSRLLLR